MALYWYFDEAVTRTKQVLPVLRETETLDEAGEALGKWMDAHPRGAWRGIPI